MTELKGFKGLAFMQFLWEIMIKFIDSIKRSLRKEVISSYHEMIIFRNRIIAISTETFRLKTIVSLNVTTIGAAECIMKGFGAVGSIVLLHTLTYDPLSFIPSIHPILVECLCIIKILCHLPHVNKMKISYYPF